MSTPDPAPLVTVLSGGPYVVDGVPLRRKRIVRTELGEPVAWETTDHLPSAGSLSLCRCGASANKPYCDGSHRTADWDGTETAPATTYDERAKAYPGTGVVVRDDRGLCQHAGFCATKVTNAWRMTRASEDTAVRSQLLAMVERCPSGALTARTPEAAQDLEPDLAVAVSAVEDGPLWLTGGVAVRRSDGAPVERRNRVVLCRCGASRSKPLCDGSHTEVGFRDPVR